MPATDLCPELAKMSADMRQNMASAREALLGLDDERFNWRPADGVWSMAQCLAHLNVVNRTDVAMLREVVAEGWRRRRTGDGPYRYGFLSRYFIASMEPPPRRRFRAPRMYVPGEQSALQSTLDEYESISSRLLEIMESANGLDLARVRTPMPAVRWLSMPLGARLALINAHDRRHLWQAAQVRRHPGFSPP